MNSDWQSLGKYWLYGHESLNDLDRYKACVAAAVHGKKLEIEDSLNPHELALLDARRMLADGRISEAQSILRTIDLGQKTDAGTSVIAGDKQFILGVIEQRQGNFYGANAIASQARQEFILGKDSHRFLRSLINEKLCEEDINSFYDGELKFLQREAERFDWFDLAGNISKALACQLLDEGKFLAAESSAATAVTHYARDGSAEDRSVAYCLLAISRLMLGDYVNASHTIAKVEFQAGKVKYYLDIFQSLLSGKKPKIEAGLPLSATPWNLSLVRPNSLTNQLMFQLRQGPCTRDELITNLWGDRAENLSYRNRLYTLIKKTRRELGIPIYFNGEHYRVS